MASWNVQQCVKQCTVMQCIAARRRPCNFAEPSSMTCMRQTVTSGLSNSCSQHCSSPGYNLSHLAFTDLPQLLTKSLRDLHYPIYADYIKLIKNDEAGKARGTWAGTHLKKLVHTTARPAQSKTTHIKVVIYPIYAAYASSAQNRDTKGRLMQKWEYKCWKHIKCCKHNTQKLLPICKCHVHLKHKKLHMSFMYTNCSIFNLQKLQRLASHLQYM